MQQTLFIPRVDTDIQESYIYTIFKELNLGKIHRIDIVQQKNPSYPPHSYNNVFLHLEWNTSENARLAQERLASGKTFKVIYRDFWFWKISRYTCIRKQTHMTSK
jgi:hypothetical protein